MWSLRLGQSLHSVGTWGHWVWQLINKDEDHCYLNSSFSEPLLRNVCLFHVHIIFLFHLLWRYWAECKFCFIPHKPRVKAEPLVPWFIIVISLSSNQPMILRKISQNAIFWQLVTEKKQNKNLYSINNQTLKSSSWSALSQLGVFFLGQ